VEEKASTLQLANSEIVAAVSGSVDKMLGRGTATIILHEEALLCSLCLKSVERLVRLRAG